MRSFCATVLFMFLMPVLSAAQTKTQPATPPQPAEPAQATTPAPSVSDQTQTTTPTEPTPHKPWWEIWKHGHKAPKTPPQPATPAPTEPEQTQTEATPPEQVKPAQSTAIAASASESQGWTSYAQFQGSYNSVSIVLTEALSLGYNLTPHLGFSAGIPLITTRSPFSPVATTFWLWTTLMGEPWLDAHYINTRHGINFVSVLTGTIPPTGETRTFTTGRFNADWFNHLEHSYGKFTPFLNLEASNGTINFYYMPRPFKQALPYQTLGFMSQFEAGGSYQFLGRFSLGGSGYALVPAGPQKVYSRLIPPNSAIVGTLEHNRYYTTGFLTTGPHFISEDYGASAWLEVNGLKYLSKYLSLQAAYTRSFYHALNIYTLTINFNGTALFRKVTGTQ